MSETVNTSGPRAPAPRVVTPWSAQEIAFLKSAYGKRPTAEIADFLDRSEDAVIAQAHRTGLSKRRILLSDAELADFRAWVRARSRRKANRRNGTRPPVAVH